MTRNPSFHPDSTQPRAGFSVFELLVCLGCLIVLLAIFLPWLLTARDSSREKNCLTRAKSMSDAVIAFADSNADQLPYLVDDLGWPVALAPYLDLPGATTEAGLVSEAELKKLSVPLFVCPDDPRLNEKQGALSYAMNSGYGEFPVDDETGAVSEIGVHMPGLDWNGDGEITDEDWLIGYATGVCWRPDPRPDDAKIPVTLSMISAGDGTEFTLLLAENLNAGHWLSRETMDLAFVIGRERFEFASGDEPQGPLHFTSVDLGPFAVNGNQGTLPGRCPAPSSLHGDFAHVMYCDGHGGPMSSEIDPRAYAALLTSAGAMFGQGETAPPMAP